MLVPTTVWPRSAPQKNQGNGAPAAHEEDDAFLEGIAHEGLREVLAAVRKLCPGIPVVLASGYDPLSMDADDYPDQPQMVLSKPYGFAELQEAIETVIAEGI